MIGSIGYGMQGQSSGVREKMHQFMQSLSPEERQAFHQSQQGGIQGGMKPPPPPGMQGMGIQQDGMQGMNGMQPPPPPPGMQGGMNSIGGNNLTSEVRQKFEQFEQTLNPQEKQELHMMMQSKRQQMSGFNGGMM
ncbi:MAG: hypothetical protein ABRQ39_26260 [Candidatus Eremiobacterota bacterium]